MDCICSIFFFRFISIARVSISLVTCSKLGKRNLRKKDQETMLNQYFLKCFSINQAEDLGTKLFLMNKTPLTTHSWKRVHAKINNRIYEKRKKQWKILPHHIYICMYTCIHVYMYICICLYYSNNLAIRRISGISKV